MNYPPNIYTHMLAIVCIIIRVHVQKNTLLCRTGLLYSSVVNTQYPLTPLRRSFPYVYNIRQNCIVSKQPRDTPHGRGLIKT